MIFKKKIKELNSKELPLSPLQDLINIYFFTKSHHPLNVCETGHTEYFIYIYLFYILSIL